MSSPGASSPAQSKLPARAPQRSSRKYQGLVQLVQPRALPRPVGRDPDDEAVIACALAARADLIVSGDQDLLVLKTYRRIRILSAAEALELIAQSR